MRYIFCLFQLFFISLASAQDTFSIVAADSSTREVGSAGASCVDLFLYNITDPSFLGDLLPDTGAINTQASYLAANQTNARTRMRAGDSPAQIISWLIANDAGSNPNVRQYGIVGFSGANVSAAAHTGSSTTSYANHLTGSVDGVYYSIQGNILLNQGILDSMEARFRSAEGDIKCRLMAALQGAKVVGADTRCASNMSSSLFAFIKVAQPSDQYGSPSFSLSVRTKTGAKIEPIDSLQKLFDGQHICMVTKIPGVGDRDLLEVYPNPSQGLLSIRSSAVMKGEAIRVCDAAGRILIEGASSGDLTVMDISSLKAGYYFVRAGGTTSRFIKL